jgi:hypothetical protein
VLECTLPEPERRPVPDDEDPALQHARHFDEIRGEERPVPAELESRFGEPHRPAQPQRSARASRLLQKQDRGPMEIQLSGGTGGVDLPEAVRRVEAPVAGNNGLEQLVSGGGVRRDDIENFPQYPSRRHRLTGFLEIAKKAFAHFEVSTRV